MKKCLLIIMCACLLILANKAYADDKDSLRELFYQGNIYYGENDLQEAIDSYNKALNCGYESSPLYYNLGNAYFKNGNLGKAITCYLRASRINPGDPDIKSNLAYARSLIQGGLISLKKPWFIRGFLKLTGMFSLNKITSISIFIYILFCVVIIAGVYIKLYKKTFILLYVLISIMLATSLTIFAVKFKTQVTQKNAIVTKQETDVKFEPLDNATTFFTLYEGEEVQLVATNDEYLKIKRSDGKQGWVKKTDIELI